MRETVHGGPVGFWSVKPNLRIKAASLQGVVCR